MNSFQLKLFAMLLMILDHLCTYVPNMPVWFNFAGRLVAPIFFYFVVEGFFHTKNRKKYLARLLIWSLVMFAGNHMVQALYKRQYPIHNNIFLSLAMAVVLIGIIHWTKTTKKYFIGAFGIIAAIAISIFTEASIFGVAMTLVFYFFREKKVKMSVGYILVSLTLTLGLGVLSAVLGGEKITYDMLFIFDYQWAMIFALPLILLYNGQRGPNTKFSKYLFYVFYPFHLWIIHILGFYMGGK